MRGTDHQQADMYSYLSPEQRVRESHPLRKIRAMADEALKNMSERFDGMYAKTGRPSIPPEKLLRAQLIQMLYSVRSERLLMEEIDYSMLFRWFVGMNLDEPVWDVTVFTKNRNRLLEGDVAREFLAEVVQQAESNGLTSDEHFTVDGTLIEAWASLKTFQPKGEKKAPPDDPGNPSVDFHGEKRSNQTHESTTDPDALLARKGNGKEAKLSYNVETSHQTMCGWMARCADLLRPLYGSLKETLFQSKVIGTDDTSVKVLDAKLPFARTGRIWPYYGDQEHPVIVYDYTAMRERAGPEKFLEGYRGYLQADAYSAYDAFFKDPARGLTEVACWAHARRYYHRALESDRGRMGPALLLIAQLYRVEALARGLTAEERLRLRQLQSRSILDKLHNYLLEIKAEILPKSPEGRAVRNALKNWTALTRYCEDGDLAIDNNATERAIRGVAVGRNNWVFFGGDEGGKTGAVLRSFTASCQRAGIDPWRWFQDVLRRIGSHPISRLAELLRPFGKHV